MTTATTKYQPKEILEIIRANYKQQQQYDNIVLKDHELNFETTILEWRDICDLLETDQLWEYLNFSFQIDIDYQTWQNILEPEDKQTLKELCKFIVSNSEKEIIKPIKLFGQECETAGIFRTLTNKLKNKGIDTSEIKPSSKLETLITKYGAVIIEEINQIDPNVLPPINYKSNWVYKWGLRTFMTLLLVTIILGFFKSNIAWTTGIISFIGYLMTWIGAELKPKQANFENLETIADVVQKIKSRS